MDPYTGDEELDALVQERMTTLDPALKRLFDDAASAIYIESFAASAGLSTEQTDDLKHEIMLMMLGFTPPDDFSFILMTELEMPPRQAFAVEHWVKGVFLKDVMSLIAPESAVASAAIPTETAPTLQTDTKSVPIPVSMPVAEAVPAAPMQPLPVMPAPAAVSAPVPPTPRAPQPAVQAIPSAPYIAPTPPPAPVPPQPVIERPISAPQPAALQASVPSAAPLSAVQEAPQLVSVPASAPEQIPVQQEQAPLPAPVAAPAPIALPPVPQKPIEIPAAPVPKQPPAASIQPVIAAPQQQTSVTPALPPLPKVSVPIPLPVKQVPAVPSITAGTSAINLEKSIARPHTMLEDIARVRGAITPAGVARYDRPLAPTPAYAK